MENLPLPCLSGSQAPQVGGQAVIEGVMMRSPDACPWPCAGRGTIVLKEDAVRSWTKKE